MNILLKIIPTRLISSITGYIVRIPLPFFLRRGVLSNFVKLFSIDHSESEKEFSAYRSLDEYFTRRLKPSVREIEDGFVSPCDGVLSSHGEIRNEQLIQAKGLSYALKDLLGEDSAAFEGGYFCTIYLAPKNYHRVHLPYPAIVASTIALPGRLLPVQNWCVEKVKNLFSENYRVIFRLKGFFNSAGQVTGKEFEYRLVMVGALNVGSIEVVAKESSKELEKGSELGIFHLGSTVILVFPKDTFQLQKTTGPVLMGETIGVYLGT
jgi:phosphatidylserine decarboxylase